MIFGFNTDIRHEDTVYHVQSEAREGRAPAADAGLRPGTLHREARHPLWFQRGGRHRRGDVSLPGNDQDKEKILRELHREVLDAIRDGKLDSILDKRDTPEALAAVKQLDLQWVNAGSVHSGGALTMHIRVTDGGPTVSGARLTLRFARTTPRPTTRRFSPTPGNAEMNVQVDERVARGSSVCPGQLRWTTATAQIPLRIRRLRQE